MSRKRPGIEDGSRRRTRRRWSATEVDDVCACILEQVQGCMATYPDKMENKKKIDSTYLELLAEIEYSCLKWAPCLRFNIDIVKDQMVVVCIGEAGVLVAARRLSCGAGHGV